MMLTFLCVLLFKHKHQVKYNFIRLADKWNTIHINDFQNWLCKHIIHYQVQAWVIILKANKVLIL